MWGKIWAFVQRFGRWIAATVGGLLLVVGVLSDLVSLPSFLEDLGTFLGFIKPTTDFFARQPEWIFYPLCLLLLACGLASTISDLRLVVTAIEDRAAVRASGTAFQQPSNEPRVLTPWQIDLISRTRGPARPGRLSIAYVDEADCYDFARAFVRAFNNSISWDVQPLAKVEAPSPLPRGGLIIYVSDRDALEPQEENIVSAMERAHVSYEIRDGRLIEQATTAQIIVTPRPGDFERV